MIPLEPDAETMRRLAGEAVERVIEFLGHRGSAPTIGDEPAAPCGPPPEIARPVGELLDQAMATAGTGIDPTNPGFLGFIPGGGLFAAALADFVALNLNRYVTIGAVSPAMVAIERSVGRFLCDLCAMPPESAAVLTSGGSTANLSAVVAARTHGLGDDLRGARMYVSEQAHQSVAKAALIAGLPRDAVGVVATDAELRMDPGALAEMIAADRSAGRRPFLVVATAGTTNTGAIDPVPALADLARDEGLWLHVDAAYGGGFLLTERGRTRLAGIERADTVTLDPHKGLFLPYGTGALVARDPDRLRAAHAVAGSYLRDVSPTDDEPELADISVELTREARGLRLWLPLHLHGVAAFRAALDEKLDLAEVLREGLAADPRIEIPWAPQLSVVPFALAGGDNAANARLLDRINATRRIFVSSTTIAGRLLPRACVLCQRTDRARIDEAVTIIRDAAAEASLERH